MVFCQRMSAHIDRYGVVEILGRGSTGTVYRCEDPGSGHEVAVKVLEGNADLSRVKAIRTLDHPRIVQIYDFLTFENSQAVVMELLRGSFLQEILQTLPRLHGGKMTHPKLSRGRTLAILSQIAEGLDYAHERGVIHGDLKPSNIHIQEGDRAKLAFRIPIIPPPMGDQWYLAPEELTSRRGEPPTRAVDQYHLALIAHEMLTGGLPYANTLELMFRIARGGEYYPGAEDAQRLGSASITTLRRALDTEPAKRFASCGECIRALE